MLKTENIVLPFNGDDNLLKRIIRRKQCKKSLCRNAIPAFSPCLNKTYDAVFYNPRRREQRKGLFVFEYIEYLPISVRLAIASCPIFLCNLGNSKVKRWQIGMFRVLKLNIKLLLSDSHVIIGLASNSPFSQKPQKCITPSL